MRSFAIVVVVASLLAPACGDAEPGSERTAEEAPERAVAEAPERAAPAGEPAVASPADPCREPEGIAPDRVVVRMCGRVLTVEDLLERLDARSPTLRERYQQPEALREAVSNEVRFALLVAEGEQRGLADSPSVRRARDEALVRLLIRREIDEAPGSGVATIGDDEVEAYYAEHRDDYDWPEQIKVSHIQLSDRAVGEKLLAEVLAAPDDAGLFARLVTEHSEDAASRERSGELPFTTRLGRSGHKETELSAELLEVAFSLKERGDVHPALVRDPSGWHIVKLVARRPAVRAAPKDARRMIRNQLWSKRREQRIEAVAEEARERLGAEIDEAGVERLRKAIAQAAPAP